MAIGQGCLCNENGGPILVYWAILIVQVVGAYFFNSDLSSVIGSSPIASQISEFIELGAALGPLIGVVLGSIVLRRTLARNHHVAGQMRTVSSVFMKLLDESVAD